jgi:hypothetical protein
MMHNLIKTGDPDVFSHILDPNGEVCLSYCRRCKKGEGELGPECIAIGEFASFELREPHELPVLSALAGLRFDEIRLRLSWADYFSGAVQRWIAEVLVTRVTRPGVKFVIEVL